jgi:exodeoxyribonuclease V gamma subunit
VLYLHRSERSDHLVDALGDLLLQPLVDPMAREVVAVPTRGVERWLSQRLSHRLGASNGAGDGVCANIDFPFPGGLVAAAMTAAFGPGLPQYDKDPWAPQRSVWPLLQLVDEHLDDELMWPLAAHLRASAPAGPGKGPRRFAAVRHIADLFDRYAVHRPEMLLAWKEGAEAGPPSSRPADVAWQAELWRHLRHRLGFPSPAERFITAPALIEAAPELLDLPDRVSVFGLTRLPASHLRVLKAISAGRDVHLFLLHPSGALWEKMAPSLSEASSVGLDRAGDRTVRVPSNPLLRSWGRDAREMQLVLAAQGVSGGEHRPVEDRPSTLLGLVQADIRADRSPPGIAKSAGVDDARPLLAEGDDSLRAHSCHGRARQVEVVREAVLHLLAADPTLEPRDVIIMCPDIELFAPLIQASFGVASLAGAPELRARLADRSLRQTNPLLAVSAHLLELAEGKVTAAQVLDFASRGPVSRRFGFDGDELSQVERWLAGTGTHWGLDQEHRALWKLGRAGEVGTWRAGLDRLLLGVAMSEDGERLFGGTLPFGDISSGEIDLAGRFAELVDRLRVTLGQLKGPHSAGQWADALAEGTARLAVAEPADAWQTEQLGRALDDVAEEALAAGPASTIELDLPEARTLLADRLKGRPTRANFRTGDMTICTLVPMRSVPHRVVCLLGLDDGLFPRPGQQDGDDLLLASPQVGDRDVPREDRQLLLDALLAATEHLVLTFEGRDQHLNQRRPPAVPVSELLDVVDRTVRLEDGARPAREAVVVQHPLQAFDPVNFTRGRLGVKSAWRFDKAELAGARAVTADRHPRAAFLPKVLPPVEGTTVQLSSLVRFLEHPVKAFLRERIGFYADDFAEQLSDALPIELGPLERWALGDRLLETRLAGASSERALAAERGRGLLPPGPLGDAALAEVEGVVEALVAAFEALPSSKAPAATVEVNIALPDGFSLVGTVPGAHGGTILRCTYSKLRPKHRLRAWAQFLALSAAHPGLFPSAVTIGQGEGSTTSRPRVGVSTLGPLLPGEGGTRAQAIEWLQVLVDLYRRGMREPLPIYCATSAAWAAAASPGSTQVPDDAARARWASNWEEFPGEDSDPEHVAVLGPEFPFEHLVELLPRPDEEGQGWAMDEPSRLGRLAMRLWGPLLSHEHLPGH